MINELLAGKEIVRIIFDYAFTLETADEIELRFETLFDLAISDDLAPVAVDPAHVGSSGASVLDLIHRTVSEAHLRDDGRIRVDFAGGGYIRCAPDENYEAWALTAPTGQRFICLPGSGVAQWSATE